MIWSLTRATTSSTTVPPNGDCWVEAWGTAGRAVAFADWAWPLRAGPANSAATAKGNTIVTEVLLDKAIDRDCESLKFMCIGISKGLPAHVRPAPCSGPFLNLRRCAGPAVVILNTACGESQ